MSTPILRPILQKTITETFLQRVQATPDKPGFQFKPTTPDMGPMGQWTQLTFAQFYEQCRLISYGLMNLGIGSQDDKVAILSHTRVEWSLCDMAILGAQAVTIPIYSSLLPEDIAYICTHSEAKILIVEEAKQLRKILGLQRPPTLQKIIVMDPAAVTIAAKHPEYFKDILSLQALKELGKREMAKNPDRFDKNLTSANSNDLITICYTSGTTGIPKGVMLTHDNLMSVLEDITQTIFNFGQYPQHSPHPPNHNLSNERILSFLPFSHIFGKLESMLVYPYGWLQSFAENLDTLLPNMKEVKPTILLAVPRVFEKIYGRIHTTVEKSSPIKRELFAKALAAGQNYYKAIWANERPSLRSTLEYQVAKKIVFDKIVKLLGGKLKFAVSGGAPLPREIGEFFQILGIQILEGYGLTETCAPIAVNTPTALRFGTVGRPLPEVTLKIADDGEILIKSRKIFKGYFKMPQETEEVFYENWFHTGDIGHIDSSGYLHITDRKKDLIITSGGKNIAPQKIENLAKTKKYVNQFFVFGDGKPYLTALVTLNRELIIQYANEHEILYSAYEELIKNPRIIGLAQKSVDEVNKNLARFETIKKFIILPHEFSIETGELTPSLKIKRKVIAHKYQTELDSLYT